MAMVNQSQPASPSSAGPSPLDVARSKAIGVRPASKRRTQPQVAAQPQHFDIGVTLPLHLRPTGFIDLEAKRDEIMQYLMGDEGMAGVSAQMYVDQLETDLMASVGH